MGTKTETKTNTIMLPENLLMQHNVYKSKSKTPRGRDYNEIIYVKKLRTDDRIDYDCSKGQKNCTRNAFIESCEPYADLSNQILSNGLHPIGAYVVCLTGQTMEGKLFKVTKHKEGSHHILENDRGGSWSKNALRFATEEEILASKYAPEYKHLKQLLTGYKTTNFIADYGLQTEITTDRQPKTGVAGRLRRSTSKATNGGRYIGNGAVVKHRKAKVGRCEISATSISAGGLRCPS